MNVSTHLLRSRSELPAPSPTKPARQRPKQGPKQRPGRLLDLFVLALVALGLTGCEAGSGGSYFAVGNTSTAEQLAAAPAPPLAWALGHQISATGISYSSGTGEAMIREMNAETDRIAKALGVTVPADLPGSSSEELSSERILEVVRSVTSPAIAAALQIKHGAQVAGLFETAVGARLLRTEYTPENAINWSDRVQKFEHDATRAGLPPELWKPLAYSINANRPAEDVVSNYQLFEQSVEQRLRTGL